ncbi:hypothetical protein AAFF_G00046810 [Aldrovandia affinis]|uniref:Uncharacterized protein n=1 Tax=Aldrovandia affinis TaxID=143900 RepID=A0AAD7WFA8_9TELE|nr:hypothetical protein AAFF_G00046810 [Aldrovandia affinis]
MYSLVFRLAWVVWEITAGFTMATLQSCPSPLTLSFQGGSDHSEGGPCRPCRLRDRPRLGGPNPLTPHLTICCPSSIAEPELDPETVQFLGRPSGLGSRLSYCPGLCLQTAGGVEDWFGVAELYSFRCEKKQLRSREQLRPREQLSPRR